MNRCFFLLAIFPIGNHDFHTYNGFFGEKDGLNAPNFDLKKIKITRFVEQVQ
jgi:hypothetical protein